MLSVSTGYDPGYLTRQVGKGAENYYLSAVAEAGEPAGRWTGRGVEELGLTQGGTVDEQTMHVLYGRFVDPRDPNAVDRKTRDADKAHLGKPPRSFKTAAQIFTASQAAEPNADAERVRELEIAARKNERSAVFFLDATYSPSKSISLLHAGLQAAGREEEAAQVWAAVEAGNQAMLEFLQDEAGYSRAGYHGRDVAGRSSGRFVDAHDWIIASFNQHTSRDGDPQLHIHNAILNRVQCGDGAWRTVDSRAVHRTRGAAAALAERVTEEQLSAALGVEFRSRPDGHGREAVGIDQQTRERFSARRATITAQVSELAQQYQEQHGYAPSAFALHRMSLFATLDSKTRKRKEKTAPTREQLLARWEAHEARAGGASLAQTAEAAVGRVNPEQVENSFDPSWVVEAALAEAEKSKAVFTRSDVTRAINQHLPDTLGGLAPTQVRSVLTELTDAALAPEQERARLLGAPAVVPTPARLQRPDGRSIYEPHDADRYATETQFDREARLLAAAERTGAPCIVGTIITTAPRTADRTDGAETGAGTAHGTEAGATVGAPLHTAAEDSAEQAQTSSPHAELLRAQLLDERGLSDEQTSAVAGIVTSGRALDVLVGPAGTGKSRAVGELSGLWNETGAPVLGLSLGQQATNELGEAGVERTLNIREFREEIKRGRLRLEAGQLLLVDEAGMAPTDDLAAIQDAADAAGAKTVWLGDPHQLEAPEAGGAMRLLTQESGCWQLSEVRRMRAGWERDASLALRAGDPAALEAYDRHGRITEGSSEEMTTAAYQGWLADHLAGRDTLLLASTNQQADELATRARNDLVRYGYVDDTNPVELRGGTRAGAGDLIQARKINRRLDNGAGGYVTNREVYRVLEAGEFPGSLRVARQLGADPETGQHRWGETVTLPSDYVEDNVELAYASTVHGAQGASVDTTHAYIDENTSRELLYVALSRGRDGNYAYVDTQAAQDREAAGIHHAEQQQQTPPPRGQEADEQEATREQPAGAAATEDSGRRWSVLSGILDREGAQPSATEALREEQDRADHLGHLGPIWTDQIEAHTYARYDQLLAQTLDGHTYQRVTDDEAYGSLQRLLRAGELAGHDPNDTLQTAIRERELSTADSAAQVLTHRVQKQWGGSTPTPHEAGSFLDRTPRLEDPDLDRHLGGIAAAMDARTAELGQRTAEQQPQWALDRLGPVPDDPLERGDWTDRAGTVAAYREQYGHEAAADAIGPCPPAGNPEARAAWHGAYTALGAPEHTRDYAAASDGELLRLRAAYAREAAWAPEPVADQLSSTSRAAREREGEATRLRAEADATSDAAEAQRTRARAGILGRMAGRLGQRRDALTEVDEARQRWHNETTEMRGAALEADAELRRRRPDAELDPLPTMVDDARADAAGPAERAAAFDARREQARREQEQGLTPEPDENQLTLFEREQAEEVEARVDTEIRTGHEVDESTRAQSEPTRAERGEAGRERPAEREEQGAQLGDGRDQVQENQRDTKLEQPGIDERQEQVRETQPSEARLKEPSRERRDEPAQPEARTWKPQRETEVEEPAVSQDKPADQVHGQQELPLETPSQPGEHVQPAQADARLQQALQSARHAQHTLNERQEQQPQQENTQEREANEREEQRRIDHADRRAQLQAEERVEGRGLEI